ncbi:MAG TPA: hypothetical protein VIJ70_04735 [Gaiellaceae bacterium]
MADVLGLLGIAFFIVCVISLAAGVTWLVVKISPSPAKKQHKTDAKNTAT